MPGKVSWLDSCGQESTIHITSNDQTTLCGYSFTLNFNTTQWIAYRVSKKQNICKGCLKIAKQQNVDFKVWSEIIPRRNMTDIPNRTKKRNY